MRTLSTRDDTAVLPGITPASARFQPESGRGRRPPLAYSLWLAAFPQPEAAQRIAGTGERLCREHRLNGALQSPARLHMSLIAIDGGTEAPLQLTVDAALDAAAGIPSSCRPIRIVFDRALTFAGSNAFVLRCTVDSDAAVGRLRQMLQWMLKRRQLRPAPSRTPHMTLMYGARPAVGERAIEPIEWEAQRVALVLSHVGATHHQWIRQWTLGGG
ncbi:MAG: 2'-5' RNA ligase family protein [Rubrivivax sp.]